MSNRDILYTAFDVVPSPKGASTHITYFTRGLCAAGYNVTLITAGDNQLPEHDTYAGARLLRVPETGETNFLRRAVGYGGYVHDHIESSPPYALYHVRDVWGGLPLLEQRGRPPLVFEVNGLPSVELKYHYPALGGAAVVTKMQARENLLLHHAEAIICVSEVTRAYLHSRGVARHKIEVIPNGVDPDLFCAAPLPAPGETATLLYTGTLADWQGLQTAVQALPHILAHKPAQLRIVGRARKRHRKMIEKLARKLGVEQHITLEDAAAYEDIPNIIAAADVCLAPLAYNDRNVTQGCCPLKILEYMACGRPIVASNLPVVRELVREDAEALLFDPASPTDLARAVVALLHDRTYAAQMGANAAVALRERFTWALAQTRLREVYARLLNT